MESVAVPNTFKQLPVQYCKSKLETWEEEVSPPTNTGVELLRNVRRFNVTCAAENLWVVEPVYVKSVT